MLAAVSDHVAVADLGAAVARWRDELGGAPSRPHDNGRFGPVVAPAVVVSQLRGST